MRDREWRTLAEISGMIGDPEASVSARLRDLRKAKFGGHEVEREYLIRGQHRYRLTVNSTTPMPLGYGDPTIEDEEDDSGD